MEKNWTGLVTTNCSNVSMTDNMTMDVCDIGTNKSTRESIGLVSLAQVKLARYILFYYILPFVVITGILGNTVSLSVLRVSKQGYAFKVYLLALTIVDILLLLTALTRCVFYIISKYPDNRYPALVSYGEYYLSLVFGGWLSRMSATLISIISIERFVAVAFPFKVKTIPIEKRPFKTLAVLLVVTFILQVPTVVLIGVEKTINAKTNTTVYSFALRHQVPAAELVRHVYLITLAVVYMFIPLVIVAISTIGVVIRLKLTSSSSMIAVTSLRECRDRDTMMTVTLFGMATIFTICYVPAIGVFFLPVVDEAFYRRESLFVMIIVDVNIVCICINSASDFVIYFFASRHFRALFVKQYLQCLSPGCSQTSSFTSTSSPTPYTEKVEQSPYIIPCYSDRDEPSTDITEM